MAFVTQTTLSVDDTIEIVKVLEARFPNIAKPHKEDICYATTNRQDAVKKLSQNADLLLVIGSKNSSNSLRLKEVGEKAGLTNSHLIDDASAIDWAWSVSYTHLDVYKRQIFDRDGWLFWGVFCVFDI